MIENVERISIITHKDLQRDVVEALTRLGTVHIEKVCGDDYLACKELTEQETEELRRHSLDLSKVEFLLGFLRKYQKEKPGFVSTLIKPKYHMTYDEFLERCDLTELERFYDGCYQLEKRLLSLTERRDRLAQELEQLEYWVELEMPMGDLRGNTSLRLTTLRVSARELDAFMEGLEADAPESSVEVVSRDETWAACILLHLPSSDEQVAGVLSRHTYETVEFRDLSEEPLERVEQLRREIATIDRRRGETISDVESYAGYIPELEVMREFLMTRRRQCEITTDFGATRSTVVIDGWVTESGLPVTVQALTETTEDIAFEKRPPGEEENPPVSLKNRDWLKPFEILTMLYGIPNRHEYDPTWLVAISFVVFFGFCIGDVGYGLLFIAAFLLMRKYLPLGENTKNLSLVLVYGSFFAIIFGVLTGSWFGYDPNSLPQFMKSMQVFDPLNSPIPVMLVCMVIGILHMLAGTIVEFRDNIRLGNTADALIGQGLVILLILGTATAAGLSAAGVLPATAVFIVAGSALGGMIVLGGHGNKTVPGKMFGGLYETYNTLVGWLGDTVSYLRLFALGLATFAVGWVINTLGGMVRGIAPVVGILFMLVLVVVGHTFNMAVNLLSAFVHPLRLEYVEFFGKFFENGGRSFRPLKVDSKIVYIKDGY